MKKLLTLFVFAAIAALVACGPSADDKAKKEQAKKDSIENAEAADEARLDSIATAEEDAAKLEEARLDSIANAEEEANNKPAYTKPKTTPTKAGDNKTGGGGRRS